MPMYDPEPAEAPAPEPLVHRPSQVSPKTVFTVAFCLVGVAALVEFLIETRVSVILTVGGAMAAVALDHAVTVFTRRGLRRGLAIAVVLVLLLAAVVGFGFLLIPPIASQGKALVAEAPALWKKLHALPLFIRLDRQFDIEAQVRQAAPSATHAVAPVLTALSGALTGVAGLLAFLFLAVFMLVFGGEIVQAALAEAVPSARERYRRVARKVYQSVGGYLGGLLGICAINATLTTTVLAVLHVPFFLPLGVLSGTSSLIPYAGPLVAGTTITFFVLVTGGGLKALAVGIYFVLYGQLEGNVLAPLIFRRTVDINPLVTLLAILFLAEFMGVPGAIIAVPVAAAGQIVMRELLALRRERLEELAPPPAPQGR